MPVTNKARLQVLLADTPYLRLGPLYLMPPQVYFEWLSEQNNNDNGNDEDEGECAVAGSEFEVEEFTESYKLTLYGAGCIDNAQLIRDEIKQQLRLRPNEFERHLGPCAQFEEFTLRQGFLTHVDFQQQLVCEGILTMNLKLIISGVEDKSAGPIMLRFKFPGVTRISEPIERELGVGAMTFAFPGVTRVEGEV